MSTRFTRWLASITSAFLVLTNSYAIDLKQSIVGAMAVQRSRDLVFQEQQLRLASQRQDWEFRKYLPHIGLNWNGNDETRELGTDSNQIRLGLSLRQVLYDGGKISRGRDQANRLIELGYLELENARLALANQAEALYRNIVITQQSLKVRQDSLSLAQDQLVIMEKEYSHGTITLLDLLGAQNSMASIQVDLAQAAIELDTRYQNLRMVLDLPANEALNILADTSLDAYRGNPQLPSAQSLKERIVAHNPEIQKARLEAQASSENHQAAQWAWLPEISLDASYSVYGPQFPLRNSSWNLGIVLAFDLFGTPTNLGASFGGDSNDRRTRQGNSNVQVLDSGNYFLQSGDTELIQIQAYQRLELAESALIRQLEQALTAYELKRRKLISQSELMTIREKVYQISQKSFQQGTISRMDLLKSLISLDEARVGFRNELIALYDADQALAALLGLSSSQWIDLIQESIQ